MPRLNDNIECFEYNLFEIPESIQVQWDDCVCRTNAEIYLTYDWLRIWWKYYGQGRKLRLFVFVSDHRVVGVIPLFSETIWIPLPLYVVKFVGTDFTTSSFRPAVEKSCLLIVLKYVLEQLKRESNYFIFHLGPLSGWMENYEIFRENIKEILSANIKLRENKTGVQTVFKLKSTIGEYLSSLPKKTQHELRRKGRVLQELLGDGQLTVKLASQKEISDMFERFYLAHQSHWHKLRRLGHFGDCPRAKEFHLELANKQMELNRLRLLELRYGEVVLGYKYAYKFGTRWVEVLDARNDDKFLNRAGIGNILFVEQLKMAIQEGANEIDSKAGEYEHKKRLGGDIMPIHNLFFVCNTWPCKISLFIDRLMIRLLHLFYYKIWYHTVAQKFKIPRASLWNLWIRTNIFR